MAFSCTVYALDAGAKRRLKLAGVPVSVSGPTGRNPTIRELKDVLGGFADYRIDSSDLDNPPSGSSWHVEVWHSHRPALHPWCFIAIDEYRGEDKPQGFRFVRGTPELMIRIVQALAERLGPLVLQPDGSQPAVVVQAAFEASAFVESWRTSQPPDVKRPPLPTPITEKMDSLLSPTPTGYVSKHRFDKPDVESRLARIRWFANCGQACPVDLTVGIKRVTNWTQALSLCASHAWSEVELAAQNQLTEYLHWNDHENYQSWNRFLEDRNLAVLDPLLREHIQPFQASHALPDCFLQGVRSDIRGALMEEMYAGSGYAGNFFNELLMVYEAGHFPCGWVGEWPEGKLCVY